MDCLKPGDVAIFATPPAFRWVHFKYAIEKGLNVFMEKPVTVDGPTTTQMFELAEESEKKNLKVGVGLMCRHCVARKELHKRIKDGADRRHRAAAGLPHGRAGRQRAGPDRSPKDMSELEYQIRQFHGVPVGLRRRAQRLPHPQHRRVLLDEGRLAGQGPGVGGRHYRDRPQGRVRRPELRHLRGRVHLRRRHQAVPRGPDIDGCHQEFASYAHGTKGSARHLDRAATAPRQCRIFKGQDDRPRQGHRSGRAGERDRTRTRSSGTT